MPPECQLFGTLGCHLCELAEAEVMPLVDHGLLVELVDIADSETLYEAYGLRIPVLRRVDTGKSWAGLSIPNRSWLSCSRTNPMAGSRLFGYCMFVQRLNERERPW